MTDLRAIDCTRWPHWRSEDGSVLLINADCLEVLPTLPKVDAVVTDPPYGVKAGRMSLGKWRTSRMVEESWDDAAPCLDGVMALEVPTVIWGGNYFPLPPSRRWLVWDKGAGFKGRDFAECELAWCSADGNARVLTYDPLARGDYRTKEHPTQKPLAVMEFAIRQVAGETILDPFLGSGTTAVAAARLGRQCIGIEREPKYFDIAVKRVQEESSRFALFTPPPAVTEQALFVGDA